MSTAAIEKLYDDQILNTNYDEANFVTWDSCGLCDTVIMSVDATDFPEYFTTFVYILRGELGINEIDQFMEDVSVSHIQEVHPDIEVGDDENSTR